jgi:hypothetical protein
MKCSVCVYGLALLCSPVITSLVPLHQARRVGVAVRSEAPNFLEEPAEKWSKLETKEQKLLGKHNPVREIHVALFVGL